MTKATSEKTRQAGVIAVIEPVGGHSGMDYYDQCLCRGLLNAGLRVSLYTCDETIDPEIPGLTFHAFYRDIYSKQRRWRRALRYFHATLSSLRKAKASGAVVCHFHAFNDLCAELVLLATAKLFRRKIVLTVHDVESFAGHVTGKKMLSTWTYGLADRIIVHNIVSFRELWDLGIPARKISVIPHGHFLQCVQDVPSQKSARRALGIAPSAKVILFFGQIKDTKGLDLLIEALPEVARDVPEVLLLIAGRPWKTDSFRYDALIDKLQLRAHCLLHIGFVPNDKVADYYAAADLVALPYSRIYQSGVLLMAMSYARPVVVSDLPGMTEVVSHGVNGYVFKRDTRGELAKVLIQALQDRPGRRQLAQSALDYIQTHHDWDQIGRSTAALYQDLLSS